MEPREPRPVLPCMRAFLIVLGLLALPATALPVPAAAQSWCGARLRPWCDGRRNSTEEVICRTPRLADMDAALGAVYGAAKAADGDRAQMSWLRQKRDACGTDPQCIGLAYLERIVELGARIRRLLSGTVSLLHPVSPKAKGPPLPGGPSCNPDA